MEIGNNKIQAFPKNAPSPQVGSKGKKSKKARKELKEKQTDRAMQTFFRNSYRTHISLRNENKIK